jgi:hypothetical protein
MADNRTSYIKTKRNNHFRQHAQQYLFFAIDIDKKTIVVNIL